MQLDLNIFLDEDKRRINQAFDELLNRKDIETPDMSEYDSYIIQKISMPENIVLEFFNDVMILVLKNGIMPVKYNEYLVAQLLDEKSVFSKILNDTQRLIVMENFARIKSKQLINSQNYITNTNELYSRDNTDVLTAGEHMSGFAKFMPKVCEDQFMNIVLNIVSIYHELRYKQQKKSIESSEFNHLTYIMIKEDVIKEIDNEFCDRNYDYLYKELDAEYFALKNTIFFLNSLNLSDFKNNEKYETVMKYIKKRLSDIEERFLTAKNKKGKNNNSIQIEHFLDNEVKDDPSILKKYPILRVEYNDNGSRKSVKQIFEEFIVICREKKNRLGNYDLYKYVLFSRAGKNLEECMEIADINIPKDLTYATKEALIKLQYAVVNKCFEKIAGDIDDIIPGRMDDKDDLRGRLINDFVNADEQMTLEMKKIYDSIIGDSEER